MNRDIQSRRARRWQFSLFALLIVVTVSAALFALLQPERPPSPLVPSTEMERHILRISKQFLQTRAPDYTVPIDIRPMPNGTSLVVTYWTPRTELKLLGPRQVVVNPELNTVELGMRD